MIDFTKIQTTPVPPPIKTLQNTNVQLTKENKMMRNIMLITVGMGIILYGYYHFKKQKNESNKKNQPPRG
jgi:hypothetical protein